MSKCDKCNKNITKTKPGLECIRCEKIVHLNTTCSELTNKQLAAVRATDNLDWTCRDCHDLSPKRRSIVVPDDDDDEDKYSDAQSLKIDIKQLLGDITKEMEKTIKREMREVTQSLQFHSEKMDELIASLEACQGTIKDLKKKNVELTNKNNYLETRLGALEQRVQEMDQSTLSDCIEICNIPLAEEDNPSSIARIIAGKLNQPTSGIKQAVRLPGKKDNPGPIKVQLNTQQLQTEWLLAAKSKDRILKIVDIIPGAVITEAGKNIYIRESLTQYNKHLLWYTKKELNNIFKYIWIKKGILRVRKEGTNEKPIIIRSKEDVNKLK